MTDHKPIVGLLRKRDFEEIHNPRLSSLVEKTMRWNFSVEHMSGASIYGPDALSRFPVGVKPEALGQVRGKDQEWSDSLEAGVVAAVVGRTNVKVVSWQVVRKHGMQDPVYLRLLEAVGTDGGSWDGDLDLYRRYRDSLSVADGVVVYEGRIVVPEGLGVTY